MNNTMGTVNKTWGVLVCVPVVLGVLWWYFSTLSGYVINAPDSDDFVDVLWFFEIYLQAESFQEMLYSLFLPIHDHITLVNHLLYLLDYSIFGEVNFIHYIVIGNLLILTLCLVLARWLSKQVGFAWALALVVSIYLTIFYWHSSFWAMTSISNHVVILFAALAAMAMQKHPDKLWLAYLFAFLATFSQANGLAVFIAIGFVQWADCVTHKKTIPWTKVLFPFVVMAVVLFFYIGHQSPFQSDHHLDHQALATEPDLIHMYQRDISGTKKLEFSFLYFATSFLAFCGVTLFPIELVLLSVLLGALIIAVFTWTSIREPQRLDRFTWVMLIFILISIFLMARARGGYAGPLVAHQPRYKMYSLLLILLLANLLLQKESYRKIVLFGFLAFGLAIQITSRGVFEEMAVNRGKLVNSYYNWVVDGGMGRSTMGFYPPNQDRRLFNAFKGGYYNPYEAIEPKHKPQSLEQLPQEAVPEVCQPGVEAYKPAEIRVQAYSKKRRALGVELRFDLPPPTGAEFLICASEQAYRMMLGKENIDPETQQWLPIVLAKEDLPAGQYRVFQHSESQLDSLGPVTFK